MEFDKTTDQNNQIEGEVESNCVSFVYSKAASWPILHGSLDDAVICESSLSPVDSDGNSASRKSALVLRRPSHDCGPCEIKISFEQRHEIRQVYVKSTARVYEIYYAADRQSMNQYLCTVRCGLAAKTQECVANEYLQNTYAVTSVSPSSTGSNKLLEELKTESGGSTNEDGWVEIKDPDPSLTEDGDSSHSKKTEVRIERENQDFYEATAEISDANPCTSITIRLLSLQSGESVHLDDVYVFADPVEFDDPNLTSNEVDRSTGNPLMSMLVPALLQLSKSRMSQIEQPNPISKLKNVEQDVSQNMSSASTSVKIQKEENPSASNEQAKVTDKLECPEQSTNLEVPIQPSIEHDKSGTNNRMNESSYHIGKTLDQLVFRIARMEEFCLRFEQRMINPITSMDARLGEVEKQLKSLNEKLQLPEMHSATRTHAPDISCNDSVLGQFHTDGNTSPKCNVESLEKEDSLSYEVPTPSSDIPSAENASMVPIVITAPEFSMSSVPLENGDDISDEIANPVSDIPSIASARAHMVPSLVVTAPEFSYGEEEEEEEEEEDDDSKLVGDSPCDKLKKPVSIDDALADALAGFVSSTSIQDSTSTPDPDTSKTSKLFVSQHFEKDELVVTDNETFVEAAAENGENDNVLIIGSNSGDDHVLEVECGHVLEVECGHVLEVECGHDFFLNDGETQIVETVITEEDDIWNDTNKFMKDDHVLEVECGHDFFLNDGETQIIETVITEEDDIGNNANKFMKEDSTVLHDILDLPINSAVDYKIPILDVKFASRESSSNLSSSIEDLLLTETTEAGVTDHDCTTETDNIEVRTLNIGDDLLVNLGHGDSSYK